MKWKFAPVGVVSRHERDVVNMAQAEAFARSFDTPLVRWQLPLTETLGDESLERALYLEEPGLWATFVEGAPVNLTEVCLVLTRSLLTHLLTRLRTTYWPFTYLLLAEHKAGEEARERQPGLAGFSRARQ